MHPVNFRRGVTLVEMTVGAAIFVTIVGGIFVAMKAAQTSFSTGDKIAANTEKSGQLSERIQKDLEETSVSFVDTGFRYHSVGSGGTTYDYLTNHFWESIPQFQECSSNSCPWNTGIDSAGQATDILPHSYASTNYYFNSTGSPSISKRGRLWVDVGENICPLDNSYLYSGANLDAVMFPSARDPNGDFITTDSSTTEAAIGESKRADWQSIILYYPYYDAGKEEHQLRRLVFYLDDLFTGNVPDTTYNYSYGYTYNWTAWDGNTPAGQPTLVDLLDFGTDGTTDGVPDGSVPLSPTLSDASYDYLQMYSSYSASGNQTDAYMYHYKYMYASNWYKMYYLYLDRGTGQVYWYVYFYDYSTNGYWYRYVSFTREPEILCRNLIDLDVSTSISNPYDAQTNPLGVASANSVRVVLVLDEEVTIDGEPRHVEQVLDFEVAPRNG